MTLTEYIELLNLFPEEIKEIPCSNEKRKTMITPKNFLKMLTSSDEEITKIINKMSEKNAKETLNFAIRCLRDIDKIERIYPPSDS